MCPTCTALMFPFQTSIEVDGIVPLRTEALSVYLPKNWCPSTYSPAREASVGDASWARISSVLEK